MKKNKAIRNKIWDMNKNLWNIPSNSYTVLNEIAKSRVKPNDIIGKVLVFK